MSCKAEATEIAKTCNKEDDDHSLKEFVATTAPAIGWIGIAIAWCIQGGYGTPYLLELGLKKSNVCYVWLGAPITGMIGQPLIGSYSDKIKKRRPFIIVGAVTVFFTLIIFSNAQYLPNYALIVAIIMFWINDFCINVLMVPLRTLASDTISSSKQLDAMSWFSVFGGIGSIIAFGFGSFISNVSILYFIGAVCVISTCFITLKTVNYSDDAINNNNNDVAVAVDRDNNLCWNGLVNIFRGIKQCPLFIWKLMWAQFLIFCAFFPLWIYGTHFYGENLMKGYVNSNNIGSHEYKLYQQGVRYGNLGYCLSGIVGVISSYLIPKWFKNGENKKGIKVFWMCSYILYGVFMCIAPWVDNLALFLILHATMAGLAHSSMHIFPWMVTSVYAIKYEPENAGLILTIFNLSQCWPQILMGLLSGVIIEYANHNVASILFVGGVFGFIAGLSVYFVDSEYKGTLRYNQLEQNNSEIEMERDNVVYF